MKNMHNHAI